MDNSNDLYARYSRQITLKEFGEAGQQKLQQSKVLMIGAGGLGCAALPYLAAAGIGTLGIVDDDTVALHNLHRQVLYTMNDIGHSKAECSAAALKKLNPSIIIIAYNDRLTVSNALNLLDQYDVIIDGTDNFASRYLINDACVLLHKPLVYGAVSKFEGQVAVFNVVSAAVAVNYRDLFPLPPLPGEVANCAEAGVLGVLPAIIGNLQASETIKLITGIGTPLINRLLTWNMLNNQVYELQLTPQPSTRSLIPAGTEAFEKIDYNWFCGESASPLEIDFKMFDVLRQQDNVMVVDVRETGETPAVYEFSHLAVPLSSLLENFPGNASDTIILFCQSGKRSLQAANILTGTFGNRKKVFSLAGGILQWKRQQ